MRETAPNGPQFDVTNPVFAIRTPSAGNTFTLGNLTEIITNYVSGMHGTVWYVLGTNTTSPADFIENATSQPLNNVVITIPNGVYAPVVTLLFRSVAGNYERIEISINVDNVAPTYTYELSTTQPTESPVTVTVTVSDIGSGFAPMTTVPVLFAISADGPFVPAVPALYATATRVNDNQYTLVFTAENWGWYRFAVEDIVGNERIITIAVTNITGEILFPDLTARGTSLADVNFGTPRRAPLHNGTFRTLQFRLNEGSITGFTFDFEYSVAGGSWSDVPQVDGIYMLTGASVGAATTGTEVVVRITSTNDLTQDSDYIEYAFILTTGNIPAPQLGNVFNSASLFMMRDAFLAGDGREYEFAGGPFSGDVSGDLELTMDDLLDVLRILRRNIRVADYGNATHGIGIYQ